MLLKIVSILFVLLLVRKLFRGFIIYEQLKTKPRQEAGDNQFKQSSDIIDAEYKVVK